MRSPQALRNGGDTRSPTPGFHSTVAERKLRRFNSLILVFRLTSFSFSFAAFVFMLTNTRGSDSPHWYDFDTFRYPDPTSATENNKVPNIILIHNPTLASYFPTSIFSIVWLQSQNLLRMRIFKRRLACAFVNFVNETTKYAVTKSLEMRELMNLVEKTYRFVLAANAIVAVYCVFEMGASVWEISRGVTIFPEVLQVWFDFGHDQVFAYLLLAASAAGTSMARRLRLTDTCTASNAFCVQADIAISLGYAAFLFLGFTSLLSGFRVVCFIINGSRFHL
ncbi:CASP-like protein 4C2 isoform X1 [Neltuma alba]|uniref:CASP-like protein 4C2 isoform X1 n=1 Tax=Neltuma alba TaxID=207710 RepID=UPI0010A30ABF|nr:CASP-like protein 4C2 isoform X1 [Prosopis alba]